MATVGASVVLQEVFGTSRWVGVALITIGIAVLTRSLPDDDDHRLARSVWSWGFPVAAGTFYGLADLVRKTGLERLEEPALGALIGVGTAFFMWVALAAAVPGVRRRISVGEGWVWFGFSGVFASSAILLLFYALRLGNVSVVSPIVASQPLVVVAVSATFLRRLETVNLRTVVGAITTVAGSVLVAVS
jgi:drug/metabolite transporter (DMT)-like permease